MTTIQSRAALFFVLAAFVAGACGQTMQVGESNISVSGDLQLKWIGKGLSEKVIECEVMLNQTMLPDYSNPSGSDYEGRFRLKTTAALFSLLFHPLKILDLKLSMPFIYKQGPDGKTGPFGDMVLDISRSWGTISRFNAGLNLSFPTGYASIMADNTRFLAVENQLGSGVLGASARASYSFAPDWGIINAGASYTAGLFAERTTEYGYDPVNDKIIYDKKAFEFARDGWGASNDAGVVRPDFLGIFADFGIKTETVNHGFSIGYFYPAADFKSELLNKGDTTLAATTLAAAQAHIDSINTVGNEKYIVIVQNPNTKWEYLKKIIVTQRAFPTLTLQYNIEKNDLAFPIFLGGMVKLDYNNRLNFGGFALGLGFKFPVY